MHNRLGPYLIHEQIGRGGMGIVYSAHHEDSGEKVAIKVLPGGFSSDESFRIRFEAEIDALKQLNHPNIVQIYGFGEQDGELFYVMEFIEGRSLYDIVKNDGALHWQDVIRFSISICKSLKHAHDRGIIHRDIKLANLLLTTEGDAKLLDFGIAKLYGSNNLTADFAVVGTADYMAPEQAEGARPSAKSDLFSLSSSMYAALCGKPPFSASNIPSIMHKLRFEEPVRIGKRVEDLPRDIDHLIHSGLIKDPAKRIPTATAMMHQMQAILDGYEQLMPRQTPGLDLLTSDPHSEVQPNASSDNSNSIDDKTVAGDYDQPSPQIEDTIATPARPASSPPSNVEDRTHYTEVDVDASSDFDTDKAGKAGAMLAMILLLMMVGGLAFGVWYQLRPLNAKQLITEIDAASNQNEKLRLMNEFINRFPQHEKTVDFESAYHQLKAQDELQRFRKRVLNSKLTTGLSANELRIREIWNSSDPAEKRIGSLLGFTLMGESGSLIPPLAQQLIDELRADEERRRSQVRTEILDQIKQLKTMLEDAPEKAQRVISGLIQAYGDLTWLQDEMSLLREMADN